MDLVINTVRALALRNNVSWDVRDEALRLAADATPRIGRRGWAERQALDLIAQAECRLIRARFAAARELAARVKAEKAARESEHREALEWAGRVAGGFVLVDTGRYGHGGHWPHWSVAPGPGGWASLEEAEAEAKARNARISARWAEFIS